MGEKTLKQTLKNVFGFNMSTVTVLAICGILTATAIFEPTKTGASLYEIIVNSLTTYISTMAINSLMRDKSIRDAFELQSVQDVIRDFEKRVKRVVDHNEMEDLDRWCDEKNKANYEAQRKRILSAVGLDYKDFFEDGEYTGKEIHMPKFCFGFSRAWWLAVRQSKAVAKARYLRLSEISAQMLTTEGDDANDQYRMGRDVHTYKAQTAKSQARSKIGLAVIWGYYTAAVIANFSIINLALKIIQVVFALVAGSMDYITTTGYVTNELMGRYTKKTRILDQYHGSRMEGADRINVNEVPREFGNPNHEGTGASPTDRELHAAASANI
jgi:hypothetical protein